MILSVGTIFSNGEYIMAWLVVVFLLVNNVPVFLNSIEVDDEATCMEVTEMSLQAFPERITMCVRVALEEAT